MGLTGIMAAMDGCLFCRIVAGEVPADVVERGEHTLAFRDVAPVSPTHVLVVPTQHFDDVADAVATDPAIAAEVLAICVSVARSQGLAEGYRIVFNTGPQAGQSVGHLHAHVLGGRQHTWPPG